MRLGLYNLLWFTGMSIFFGVLILVPILWLPFIGYIIIFLLYNYLKKEGIIGRRDPDDCP